MNLPRRRFLHLAAAAASFPALSRNAVAQAFPTRPVTMIVPFPAAGPADVLARTLSERMGVSLGQSVIVENISGAAGSIGAGRVARAAPDGYTLILGNLGTHVFNGAIYSLAYDLLGDPAKRARYDRGEIDEQGTERDGARRRAGAGGRVPGVGGVQPHQGRRRARLDR